MSHLHKLNAIHRDLKLANIFIHFPDYVGRESEVTPAMLKDVNLL